MMVLMSSFLPWPSDCSGQTNLATRQPISITSNASIYLDFRYPSHDHSSTINDHNEVIYSAFLRNQLQIIPQNAKKTFRTNKKNWSHNIHVCVFSAHVTIKHWIRWFTNNTSLICNWIKQSNNNRKLEKKNHQNFSLTSMALFSPRKIELNKVVFVTSRWCDELSLIV